MTSGISKPTAPPIPAGEDKYHHWAVVLLRSASASVFIGRSWGYICGNTPFLSGYPATVIGLLFLACGVLSIILKKGPRLQWGILLAGSVLLLGHSFGEYIESGFLFPQLIETAAQVAAPLCLLAVVCEGSSTRVIVLGIRIAVAATFAAHGAFALNIFPTPAGWYGMIESILGLDPEGMDVFLKAAGFLDMVCVLWLFLPVPASPALIYMVVWGTLTAWARLISHMGPGQPLFGLDPWFFEMIVRWSNGLMPGVLLLLQARRRSGSQ